MPSPSSSTPVRTHVRSCLTAPSKTTRLARCSSPSARASSPARTWKFAPLPSPSCNARRSPRAHASPSRRRDSYGPKRSRRSTPRCTLSTPSSSRHNGRAPSPSSWRCSSLAAFPRDRLASSPSFFVRCASPRSRASSRRLASPRAPCYRSYSRRCPPVPAPRRPLSAAACSAHLTPARAPHRAYNPARLAYRSLVRCTSGAPCPRHAGAAAFPSAWPLTMAVSIRRPRVAAGARGERTRGRRLPSGIGRASPGRSTPRDARTPLLPLLAYPRAPQDA